MNNINLVAGDTGMLPQGVYPLAATRHNLAQLGFADMEIPLGAALLVLGTHCD